MIDVVEILVHWYAGRSQHELAASLGVDRKTQRKYTAPARAAGMEPGGPPMAEVDWRALVVGWFPELVDAGLRQVSWPVIECHRDYIAAQLRVGVTGYDGVIRISDPHRGARSIYLHLDPITCMAVSSAGIAVGGPWGTGLLDLMAD